MALRQIIKAPDDALKRKSKPVEKFDEKLAMLLDDMRETMHTYDGLGLAAPQIGILKRVFVVETPEIYIEAVNPEIVSREGEVLGVEGCLSLPGEFGELVRPEKLKLRAFDRYGKQFEISAANLLARAICHENDHLNGDLFFEKADRMIDEAEMRKRRSRERR